MEITDVQITVVDLGDLERPFWNSIVVTRSKKRARIEICTDEGIVGMAPCGASSTGQATILGAIKNKLVGEDPLRIGYLWDKMYMGGTRKPVTRGPYIASMSAVDNALWDLTGKSLNQPVWKLIGGTQDRVFAYAAGGYYEEGKGLRELCNEMESFVAAGFRAVKMKVGWPGVTLRQDAERVRAVREAIGPDVELMIDANNAWDAKTALKFGRMVEQYEPYWFEEPVHADDFRGGALLVSSLDVPIASGENEFTRWGARDLIESRAADIIQLDPNICGGISEWLKVAALASAYHLKVAPHGNPNIGSCCVAAVENGLITENYPNAFNNPIMAPVDFRKDGYIYMSEKPGLGIEWDEKAIAAFRIS
jgi:L-alanine-DL-glutamate epimerase-like enolase superfamily enzyme